VKIIVSKVGFTLRAIRHVHQRWLISSLGPRGIPTDSCHAQLLAVTIRVIWLVFSVEVVLPGLVHAISWRSQFIEDGIFWF